MIDGEGVGGKNPAPLNGKRSWDPGTLDWEVKTLRSETAAENTRYTNGKRKEKRTWVAYIILILTGTTGTPIR